MPQDQSGATAFTELQDDDERAGSVWACLLGLGAVTKDEAVRAAARGLRDEGRLDYQRLHATGPLYELILAAIERGVRTQLFDRPRRGHVRAILEQAEEIPDTLWERCVIESLDEEFVPRQEAMRRAATWAVERVGLQHRRMRAGGRVEKALRRALSRCIRRGEVLKDGRDLVRRAQES